MEKELVDLIRDIFVTGALNDRPVLKARAATVIKASGMRHPNYGECDRDILGLTCSECVKLGFERWPYGNGSMESSLHQVR